MPDPNRRTAFSTLWAMDAMNPSQSTFSNPFSRDFAHPSRSSDAKIPSTKNSLDYGPTASHFPPIGGSLVPFLGLKVQG